MVPLIGWQPSAGNAGSWGAGHQKEAEFNKGKLHQRRLEAFLSNSLLISEVDDALVAGAIESVENASKNRAKRARRESKVAKEVMRGMPPDPTSDFECKIFMRDCLRTEPMDTVIMAHEKWDLAESPIQATILINDDADTFEYYQRCAALVGAWVLPSCWVTTRPDKFHSWALKFRPAIETKRFVWCSPDVCASLPREVAMIRDAASLANSRWVMVRSVDQWVVKKQHAMGKKCPSLVIALVTHDETELYTGVGHVFEINGFFKFVANLDTAKSTMGMANS